MNGKITGWGLCLNWPHRFPTEGWAGWRDTIGVGGERGTRSDIETNWYRVIQTWSGWACGLFHPYELCDLRDTWLRHSASVFSGIINGQGLPWWSSGEDSACQCRGHRSHPWSGKIPHAEGQLSLCAPTTEAHMCPNHRSPHALVAQNNRSHCNEKAVHGNYSVATTLLCN